MLNIGHFMSGSKVVVFIGFRAGIGNENVYLELFFLSEGKINRYDDLSLSVAGSR